MRERRRMPIVCGRDKARPRFQRGSDKTVCGGTLNQYLKEYYLSFLVRAL
jgi:hypothetical protein